MWDRMSAMAWHLILLQVLSQSIAKKTCPQLGGASGSNSNIIFFQKKRDDDDLHANAWSLPKWTLT